MLQLYLSLISDPDKSAIFEQIHHQYESKLASIAMAITKHEYYAEEALSKTWCGIAENIDLISTLPNEALFSYLKKTIRNNAINSSKEMKKALNTQVEFNENYFFEFTENELAIFISDNDTQNELLNLLSSIPYIYRTILYYKYVLGYSRKTIATICGISEETVKTRLRRGKMLIKNINGDKNDAKI